MKFWKYSRVALALIGSVVLGLSITCCGVYTTGYMYVTGAQFNQIGAYKIDHDFGYLTPVTGSPFSNAGGTPMQEAVIPGGRYLAVVSQGTVGQAGSGSVSIYSIGGGGVIAFQHTYFTSGINPVAIAIAPAGNYLYVLDQMAPPDVVNGVDQNAGRGDVTVFAINPSSGKLTLITNQNTFNTNGTQLPYFTVNYNPVQMVTASGYLYILDQAYNPSLVTPPTACVTAPIPVACTTPDVFLYAINTSNGQLTLTQNAPLTLGIQAGAASTIALAAGGKYVYIVGQRTRCEPGPDPAVHGWKRRRPAEPRGWTDEQRGFHPECCYNSLPGRSHIEFQRPVLIRCELRAERHHPAE